MGGWQVLERPRRLLRDARVLNRFDELLNLPFLKHDPEFIHDIAQEGSKVPASDTTMSHGIISECTSYARRTNRNLRLIQALYAHSTPMQTLQHLRLPRCHQVVLVREEPEEEESRFTANVVRIFAEPMQHTVLSWLEVQQIVRNGQEHSILHAVSVDGLVVQLPKLFLEVFTLLLCCTDIVWHVPEGPQRRAWKSVSLIDVKERRE